MTVKRRNFDFASQCCLAEAHWHFAVQIVFFACKDLVSAYMHHDIKIARWTAVYTRLTFSGQPDAIAFIHTGWNLDRKRFLLLQATRTAAGCTRTLDDFAAALAFRTSLLDRKETLGHAHLPLAVTGRAGNRLAAGLRTATLASLALL